MSGMVLWLAALVVLTAVLAFGLRREFDRLKREAAWARIQASSVFRKIAADFERLKVEIGTALLPAVRQMAEAFKALEPELRRIRDAAEKAGEGRP